MATRSFGTGAQGVEVMKKVSNRVACRFMEEIQNEPELYRRRLQEMVHSECEQFQVSFLFPCSQPLREFDQFAEERL